MALLANPAEGIHSYGPCWEPDEVNQVLATLNRLAGRVSKQVIAERRYERRPYQGPVLIAQRRKGRLAAGQFLFTVMARDLSRSGIGLLAPLVFEAQEADASLAKIRAASILREGSAIDIGMRRMSGDLLWVYGTVVRMCNVQHSFHDVGVQFKGRRKPLDYDLM